MLHTDGQGSIAKDVNGDPQEEMPFRSVPRCRSALVEWSVQNSETAGSLAEAAHGCCSPPLPTPEDPKISLSNTPLSSDALSSPCSSSSRSAQAFSPRDRLDSWSSGIGNSLSFDVRLENPFNVQGVGEFSGPYSTMVEMTFLYQEIRKSDEVNRLLQNYRLLTTRQEKVDPRNLNHKEKLAFWINIHNALVMHAFLAYGIPRNNAKRVLLLRKAVYNVRGHTISTGTMQSSILGCRMSRPGQWLRLQG